MRNVHSGLGVQQLDEGWTFHSSPCPITSHGTVLASHVPLGLQSLSSMQWNSMCKLSFNANPLPSWGTSHRPTIGNMDKMVIPCIPITHTTLIHPMIHNLQSISPLRISLMHPKFFHPQGNWLHRWHYNTLNFPQWSFWPSQWIILWTNISKLPLSPLVWNVWSSPHDMSYA